MKSEYRKDKVKAAAAVLLIHAPVLIFMTGVHFTWALAALAVVIVGIVMALARPESSGQFTVIKWPCPAPSAPATLSTSAAETIPEEAREEELAGV